MFILSAFLARFATDPYCWVTAVFVLALGIGWLGIAIPAIFRNPPSQLLPASIMWVMLAMSTGPNWTRMTSLWRSVVDAGYLNLVTGFYVGLEWVLWLLCITCIVLFARNWRHVGFPALGLIMLWLLVLISSIPNYLPTAVLGILILTALALSPLRGAELLRHIQILFRSAAVANLVIYIFAPTSATWVGIPGIGGLDRLQGVFTHANLLGSALALALLIEVISFKLRSTSLMWIAIIAAELLLSTSRGAIVALCAGLLCLLVVNQKGKLRWKWLRFGLPIGFGLSLPIIIVVAMRSPYEFWNRLASGRLDAWMVAAKHLLDYPILGSGASPLAGKPPDDIFPREANVYHAHNQILQTILESGVLGLVVLAFIICGVIGLIVEFPKQRAALIALLALLLFEMFIEIPLSKPLTNPAAVLLIVLLSSLAVGKRMTGTDLGQTFPPLLRNKMLPRHDTAKTPHLPKHAA